MKLKLFQKQDLARAALHDGLILSWDTGLGKTWALYLWLLMKVGYIKIEEQGVLQVKPNKPVLIIAPGDLHQQIVEEGWTRFRVRVVALDSQETFTRLVKGTTNDGRPILEPDFYITSYSQLTTNGVHPIPDAMDWENPFALQEFLSLPTSTDQPLVLVNELDKEDLVKHQAAGSATACEFFAWRGIRWADEYHLFGLDPNDTLKDLDRAYDREVEACSIIRDPKLRGKEMDRLNSARHTLQQLLTTQPCPKYSSLSRSQQAYVVRYFCDEHLTLCARNVGLVKGYPLGDPPEGYDPQKPETDTRPQWRVKCVYQPSLADLSFTAFEGVGIDEGVKMKGEETLVGKGVRSMEAKYRLVLTATPVKNRVPDIFRLAWWATGGRAEAHARFPYRDDSEERSKFAQTFMVSERNLTAIEKTKAAGGTVKEGNSRFSKLTAEVCNVHRLWKLLGPIVLRRRKDDCGEDIVPKVRKVIRCDMGTNQMRVYKYHLDAKYTDINGRPATGAQLQALRIAAADPSATDHLHEQPGDPCEPCTCKNGAREKCPICKGRGAIPLPHVSGQAYIPKHASTLTLISEILERQEQCVVFSAFKNPLDRLSEWLSEASVRHVKLDGDTSQKKRGMLAAQFKHGRNTHGAIPVMLAGVECMAEGHSFHLANNVILIAYSWAYDKFIQAINRVHRMTSEKPVNVYVILCTGTIDRKLESLIGDKGDAAELVLDGRLIGERTEDVNLSELLKVAHREFDDKTQTIDEALLQRQWPALRDRLHVAMRAWEPDPSTITYQSTTNNETMRRNVNIRVAKPIAPTHEINNRVQTPAKESAPAVNNWRERLAARAARLKQIQKPDGWSSL